MTLKPPLPAERVSESLPFMYTKVDCSGPPIYKVKERETKCMGMFVYLFSDQISLSKMVHDMPKKKGKRKVREVPQSQTVALPRHQEEEETDKSKQAQIEQTVRKSPRLVLSSPSEVIAMLKGLKNTRTK